MKQFSLSLSDLAINKDEIYLNMGYGGQVPDAQFVEMIDQMLEQLAGFCVPQAAYLILNGDIPTKNFLEINNQQIKVGPVITRYLHNSSHFAVFVATAGAEFDNYQEQLKNEGDIVSEFLAYSIGSEIAEATVRYITDKIQQESLLLGFNCTHAYCPGYCSWHVREQASLFKLLPQNSCGVTLNASNLMHPVKSVSGIIGLGKDVKVTPHACEICGMVNCFKRKTMEQA